VGLRHLLMPGRLVHGEELATYERLFAGAIGVAHGIAFSSGRVGFYGLLKSIGVAEGDAVLLQAPTHIVVANAIRYCGARPVYVDCTLRDFNMDSTRAREVLARESRVKAIVVQHTFGIPADIDALLALARARGVVVIEDCVHALGARYRGRPVGGFGTGAFFSTEETKTISSTMGGMVVTDDDALAARMRVFQESCMPPPFGLAYRYVLKLLLYHLLMQPHIHRFARAAYEGAGSRLPLPRPTENAELRGLKPERYEQRLSNAQAALARRQLGRLEENIRHRSVIAAQYRKAFASSGLGMAQVAPQCEPSYVRFPVLVADREAAVRALAPWLVAGTWFTSVLEEAVTPSAGAYQSGSCPQAEYAAAHLINLPTHPRISPHDAERFIEVLLPVASR
jgi:dTDP-4-amino-4,6-dideoxygalactose transaminase